MTGTSGRQRAQVDRLSQYKLTKPSDAVSRAFGEVVHRLFLQIGHSEQESRTLAETRDLLLPRLMSGELRVAEADRPLEEVL